jgi:hypothetical protein
MRKILLILAVGAVLSSCTKEDNGQKYCWKCVDLYGNDGGDFKDKTEQWARENVKKVTKKFPSDGEIHTCNELNKTNCQ